LIEDAGPSPLTISRASSDARSRTHSFPVVLYTILLPSGEICGVRAVP
jgi:hypothetical protein